MPEEHLLGELNKGFYLIMANFQGERLGMALTALGEMRASFERLVEWAPALPPPRWRRHAVAELGLKVELAAAIAYGAARRVVAGEDIVREVSKAKLLTQRANLEVQEGCLRLHGPRRAGRHSSAPCATRGSARSAAARTRSCGRSSAGPSGSEGRVASQEPARMSTRPTIAPGPTVSSSTSTPAITATTGAT